MTIRSLTLGLAAALALGGCKPQAPAEDIAPATPAPAATGTAHEFSADITAADFSELVRTLASDEFEGRAPGSPGGEKTVEYIRAQFERVGLQPGNNGSWFQDVPMIETTADPATVMTITAGGKEHALTFGPDMVVGTRTGEAEVKVDASELVFVGYGIDAPERNWNDYAGIDVTGKTVVMFVNDPGFRSDDPELFDGKRMTYYGRWTYKFEEAARKGAAAAIIIHDTEGASYGWDVVQNSWSGAQFDLKPADDPAPRLPAQGWITGEHARSILADAGQDLDALREAAGKPGFKPVPLDARMSLQLKSTTAEKSSRNVVGILPGSETPDEAVVYMAHWDHLGKTEDGRIYNGAIDNATGVAGIIEVAGRMAADNPRPKRSLVFLAVTLEESGLLGSQYYVAHPAVPLVDTVAVINLDAMPVIGPARNVTVTGMGNSELEDILAEVVKPDNRTLALESSPEAGFFFRSDHFNFAKAGVPALYAKGGNDLIDGGVEAGNAALAEYNRVAYHKPDDTWREDWNLEGVVQDLQMLYQVGTRVANEGQWPNWYEGNPFRAAREKMMEGR
ncbi:MAG: M28 family metallopeptidase [Pseudoxanthomonas suwonensis]|nr:M28 family metallopeptidase [Pseudoxanthomonas suwonensis]